MAGAEPKFETIWFREHGLLWLHSAAPLPSRVFVWWRPPKSKTLVGLAEIPSGTENALISLPPEAAPPIGLFWSFYGEKTGVPLVELVEGPPLEPRLRDAGDLSLEWSGAGWHDLRLHRLACDAGQLRPEARPDLDAMAEPTEWLLTPLDGRRRQGPTHRLVVPAQSPRLVVTLSEILRDDGVLEKGWQVILRNVGHEPPPAATVVWRYRRPRDEVEDPQPVPWRSDGTAVVRLDDFAIRDEVEVRLSDAAGPAECMFQVCSFDSESGRWITRPYPSEEMPRPRTYIHWGTMPGTAEDAASPEVTPLAYHEPCVRCLREVPIFEELAGGNPAPLLQLPSAVLHYLTRLGANPTNWRRACRVLGVAPGGGLAAFLRRAQDFGLLLGNLRLLDLVGRHGLPQDLRAVTTKGVVARLLKKRKLDLLEQVESRGEAELDYCVEALVADVADMMILYRYGKGWSCPPRDLIEVKRAVRIFQVQPFDSFRKELAADVESPLYAAVAEAEEATSRALSDESTLADIRSAYRLRRHAVQVLRAHLDELIRSRPAAGPWRHLEEVIALLDTSRPASAGRLLQEMRARLAATPEEESRGRESATRLQDGAPCLLRVDAVWLSRFAEGVRLQEERLEQVGVWCVELLRTNQLPAWPPPSGSPGIVFGDELTPAHEEFLRRLDPVPDEWTDDLSGQEWMAAARRQFDQVRDAFAGLHDSLPGWTAVNEVVGSLTARFTEVAAALHRKEYGAFCRAQLDSDAAGLQTDAARQIAEQRLGLNETTQDMAAVSRDHPTLIARLLADEAAWQTAIEATPGGLDLVPAGRRRKKDPLGSLTHVVECLAARGNEKLAELGHEQEVLGAKDAELTEAEQVLGVARVPFSGSSSSLPATPSHLHPGEFDLLRELIRLAQAAAGFRANIERRKEKLRTAARDRIDELFAPLLPSYAGCRPKLRKSASQYIRCDNFREMRQVVKRLEAAVPLFLQVCRLLRMPHREGNFDDRPALASMLPFASSDRWCRKEDQPLVRQLRRLCVPEMNVYPVAKDPSRLEQLAERVAEVSRAGADVEGKVAPLREAMSDALVAAFRRARSVLGDTGGVPHVANHEDLTAALEWLGGLPRPVEERLGHVLDELNLLKDEER